MRRSKRAMGVLGRITLSLTLLAWIFQPRPAFAPDFLPTGPGGGPWYHTGHFLFRRGDINYASPNKNGRLDYRYYDWGTLHYPFGQRAGSGTTIYECEIGKGWLPLGKYDMWGATDDDATGDIRGRTWYMQDKQCAGPSTRTALFIHSEETATGGFTDSTGDTWGQEADASGDQPFRWENEDDYLSLGCIKIPPHDTDMGEFHWNWHNRGGGNSDDWTWRNYPDVQAWYTMRVEVMDWEGSVPTPVRASST